MTSEDRPALASAIDRLAALGPFFAAELHDPGKRASAPWQEMSAVLTDPAVLAARVQAGRASLALRAGRAADAVAPRVAASVIQLGLVARTLSPALALAVLDGWSGPVHLADLRWQPELGSMTPLSIAGTDFLRQAPEAMAGAFAENVIDYVAAELCEATAGPFAVSRRVLWGNVASALNGACATLAAARPDQGSRLLAVREALLRHPRLVGTAQTAPNGRFRRNSCCLIYLASPGRNSGYCGDCVLASRSRR